MCAGQAYKQMVKLEFKRGRYEDMMAAYKQMLTYIKSAVTRNYSEKVINKVLDLVSAPGACADEARQLALLHDFYETTLTALQEAKNDRLWFKTNLKLGKLWFDREEYGRLQKILKVRRSTRDASRTRVWEQPAPRDRPQGRSPICGASLCGAPLETSVACSCGASRVAGARAVRRYPSASWPHSCDRSTHARSPSRRGPAVPAAC